MSALLVVLGLYLSLPAAWALSNGVAQGMHEAKQVKGVK